MAHHKRKRTKSRRMGCMCKWYKANGFKGTLDAQTIQERVAREAEEADIDEYFSVDNYDIDDEADWKEVEEMMTLMLYEAMDEEGDEYE